MKTSTLAVTKFDFFPQKQDFEFHFEFLNCFEFEYQMRVGKIIP